MGWMPPPDGIEVCHALADACLATGTAAFALARLALSALSSGAVSKPEGGEPVLSAQRRHEAAAPLPPKCSVCGWRKVGLWLFVKRDEADVGEGDWRPNSVRMNHRRGSRGVGFGERGPRCARCWWRAVARPPVTSPARRRTSK